MSSPKEDWRAVRRERANPPALAGEFDDRKQVFQAALAQAEELWDAAAAAGPSSRPLPLFYCLSQAGRAVCAAWSPEIEFRPNSHGLGRTENNDPTPERRVFGHSARVTTAARGAFGMVAGATRSQTFAGHATVASLWASLPGFPTPRDIFGSVSRCLAIEGAQRDGDERPLFARVLAPTHCIIKFLEGDPRELAATSPALAGVVEQGTRRDVFGGIERLYCFPREDGSLRTLHDVGERPFYEESPSSRLVVRPRVGTGNLEPPSKFLTMWALLWCLSELARYYPETWVGALDPDRSTAAVTLEQGLDLALERAPSLIAEALRGPVNALLRDEVRRLQIDAARAAGDGVGFGEAAEARD